MPLHRTWMSNSETMGECTVTAATGPIKSRPAFPVARHRLAPPILCLKYHRKMRHFLLSEEFGNSDETLHCDVIELESVRMQFANCNSQDGKYSGSP